MPHISIPGAGILGKLHVPGFAEGGLVPGALGSPMLAMVHGGETVIPAGRIGGGGVGGAVFDITVNLDGETIYRNQKKYAGRDVIRNGSTGV